MTAPITKAQGDQLRLADLYEWARTNAPKDYAKEMRRQQQARDMERFAASAAGKALYAEAAAFCQSQDAQHETKAQQLQRQRASRLAPSYTLLGVEPGATATQIKKAYRQKARTLHPDKGGNEAAMKKLNAAYQKLTTPKK